MIWTVGEVIGAAVGPVGGGRPRAARHCAAATRACSASRSRPRRWSRRWPAAGPTSTSAARCCGWAAWCCRSAPAPAHLAVGPARGRRLLELRAAEDQVAPPHDRRGAGAGAGQPRRGRRGQCARPSAGGRRRCGRRHLVMGDLERAAAASRRRATVSAGPGAAGMALTVEVIPGRPELGGQPDRLAAVMYGPLRVQLAGSGIVVQLGGGTKRCRTRRCVCSDGAHGEGRGGGAAAGREAEIQARNGGSVASRRWLLVRLRAVSLLSDDMHEIYDVATGEPVNLFGASIEPGLRCRVPDAQPDPGGVPARGDRAADRGCGSARPSAAAARRRGRGCGRPRGSRSARRARCARPTPCGSPRRSPSPGSR